MDLFDEAMDVDAQAEVIATRLIARIDNKKGGKQKRTVPNKANEIKNPLAPIDRALAEYDVPPEKKNGCVVMWSGGDGSHHSTNLLYITLPCPTLSNPLLPSLHLCPTLTCPFLPSSTLSSLTFQSCPIPPYPALHTSPALSSEQDPSYTPMTYLPSTSIQSDTYVMCKGYDKVEMRKI